MSTYKTIDDMQVTGKTVLVRCDFNVPMKDGAITDTSRIERSLSTLAELSKKGARVVVLSHFGRPGGHPVVEMSLRPIAVALGKAMNTNVAFASDCVGPAASSLIAKMKNGDVAVLENLRFHKYEEANDTKFAGQLAALGDIYINDAFSCSHRAHASTEAIAKNLPSAAGRLMKAELDALSKALESPQHPVAALVGGAKISTKMNVLGNLVDKSDVVIIGGAMANTFISAQGINVGISLYEPNMADQALDIIRRAKKAHCEIVLPLDVTVAKKLSKGTAHKVVPLDMVPNDWMILDFGPVSVANIITRLNKCKTLLWNGPLGAFEVAPFDLGTNVVARAAAHLTKEGRLLSVAGGGDTVAALANAGVADDFSYISTAGGAFLEWIEGKKLPGLAALKNS
jgi:phosphoglycerate kinase